MKNIPKPKIDFTISNSNLSDIYHLQLGYYGDKYMLVGVGNTGIAEFRRVRMPKTKIDGVRLPERICISYFGSNSTKQKIKKSNK